MVASIYVLGKLQKKKKDKFEKLTAKKRNINACIVGFWNKKEKLTLGMINY